MRKRTSESCSLESVGKSTKSRTETRAQRSGRINAASRRLRLPFGGARDLTIAASFSGSRMLSRSGETEITPGSSARKPSSGALPLRAMAMPASESSKASAGGGSPQSDEMVFKRFMLPLNRDHQGAASDSRLLTPAYYIYSMNVTLLI